MRFPGLPPSTAFTCWSTSSCSVTWNERKITFLHGHNHRALTEASLDPENALVCYGHTHQHDLKQSGETLVLTESRHLPAIEALSPSPTCVVDRRPLFDVKLRSVIEGTAMPEMLLVSNRCER